jgi:hypothetical protein
MLADRNAEQVSDLHPSQRHSEPAIDTPAGPSSSELWSRSIGSTDSIDVSLGKASSYATNNVISGEWARAVVFELAGGEPAGTTGTFATQQLPRVISGASPSRLPAETPPSIDSRDLEAFERAVSVSGISWVEAFDLGLFAERSGRTTAAKLPAFALHGFHQNTSTAAAASTQLRIPGAVLDEVFERLGRDIKTVAPPTAGEDRRSDPRVAMPLLAMLVIERVASSYVARANDTTSVVSIRPLRRRTA